MESSQILVQRGSQYLVKKLTKLGPNQRKKLLTETHQLYTPVRFQNGNSFKELYNAAHKLDNLPKIRFVYGLRFPIHDPLSEDGHLSHESMMTEEITPDDTDSETEDDNMECDSNEEDEV